MSGPSAVLGMLSESIPIRRHHALVVLSASACSAARPRRGASPGRSGQGPGDCPPAPASAPAPTRAPAATALDPVGSAGPGAARVPAEPGGTAGAAQLAPQRAPVHTGDPPAL